MVQLIFEEAVRTHASDIHLEPMIEHLRVRLRIDGILEEVLILPHAMNIRVVPRIRVMCGLDPEQGQQTAKPQDGRMAATIANEEADLRLSTFPTTYGDKAVLRIIRRNLKVPKIDDLGFKTEVVAHLRKLITRPQGMIIVTGPAGNGKSTTLYTILQELNTPTRNIVTLEDPIELKIPGINQSNVVPKSGFTFASGLRSILRQDPNVVMVGEIRDMETAEIAMSASLTGHLLLSTLHTNSAMGAVVRMVDMGLEPYLIATALTAVMAQRLARRLCEKCREPYQPSRADLDTIDGLIKRTGIKISSASLTELYRGKGCPACRGSGYSGRFLLFELAALTPSLRTLILQKSPLSELQKQANAEGMETLLVDGLEKAGKGITSLDEILRVVGVDD